MAHRAQLFPPDTRKELRRFTPSSEVAALLGVKDAYPRKLSLESRGPRPETGSGGRRLSSSNDIMDLRQMRQAGTKTPGTCLPGRHRGGGALGDRAEPGGDRGRRRCDLSFIEKVNLARQLQEACHDRKGICDALSVDKTLVNRMLSIANRLPPELMRASPPRPR